MARQLDILLEQLALLVLPPRRARRYPRAVKKSTEGFDPRDLIEAKVLRDELG